MKVRVKTEFKDKHTGERHKVGDVLDLNIQRINEILMVGGFVELVDQDEQKQEKAEPPEHTEQPPDEGGNQEEKADAGETDETVKQTGRRKRSK